MGALFFFDWNTDNMLQRIRDSLKGWAAYVIVAILVVPFAFWGIGDYLGFFDEQFAAEVNGNEIPINEYRAAYNQRYARIRDLYGDSFRTELIDEAQLRQEVLEQMVDEELLYQYAHERGFRVSDERLAQDIHSRPEFQEDGVFSPERYRYLLQLSGQSPAGFERRLRRALVIGQLQRAIGETAFMPDGMLEALVRVADQRREFAWVELPVSNFTGRVEVDEAMVEDHYEANASRYMTPERVDIAWLDLSMDAVAAGIDVDDDALWAYYEDYRRERTAGERRLARHILVTPEDRSMDEARALAEDIHARIEAGEAFEDLARERSEDPDSAGQGGELGWIERGLLMPELEDVLFDMETGQVSGPVRSSFGWHLLRVDDVDEVPVPSFEEVRGELLVEYREREAETQFYDLVERLADAAFRNPDSLEPAADTVGLEVRRQAGVTRDTASGIVAHEAVRSAVFSPDVLEERYNSQLIELDGNRVVVVRVERREEPRQRPLDAVRERIRETLVLTEARRLTAEAGERIIERAREGAPLRLLADELGGVWHEPRLVGRADMESSPSMLASVFRAPHPDDGPVVRGLRIGANDYAVFQLLSVVPGAPEGLEAEDIENLDRALSQRAGNAEYQALVASLRADADIAYGRNLFDDGL